MRGFYPALTPSLPGYQRISEGERASGEIGSPDGFDDEPPVRDGKAGPTQGVSFVRRPAARVVGQFDHPLLPVPPVGNVRFALLRGLTCFNHRGRR